MAATDGARPRNEAKVVSSDIWQEVAVTKDDCWSPDLEERLDHGRRWPSSVEPVSNGPP